MDRVLSTRVDASVVDRLTYLSRHLRVSKKKVLESAISRFADAIEAEENVDILDRTFGAWHREESAADTVSKTHAAFRHSMERYRNSKHYPMPELVVKKAW